MEESNPVGSLATSQENAVIPILMPEAGNSMVEGTILAWKAQVGDTIAVGDVICEIETDKATMEFESPLAGQLTSIVAPAGKTVPVKEPIAFLAAPPVSDSGTSLLAKSKVGKKQVPSAGTNARESRHSAGNATRPSAARSHAFPISPAVRRLAREKGLDLAEFGPGSGPGGRILTDDLNRRAAAATGAVITVRSSEVPGSDGIHRTTVSRMRKTIAHRLQHAKQTIPHFYMQSTIHADRLNAAYREHSEQFDCSLNDFIVLACGQVMAQFAEFRSQMEGDELVVQRGSHVGIAVGIEDGLVVPVIRNVQDCTLKELAAETKRIIENARRGVVANMGFGSFTVSNLGMFGVEEFSAIINPPETGILAVGALREDVIVQDGALRAGYVLSLNLSADHRVVDGVTAARFMKNLRALLERPDQLVGPAT